MGVCVSTSLPVCTTVCMRACARTCRRQTALGAGAVRRLEISFVDARFAARTVRVVVDVRQRHLVVAEVGRR